VRIVALLPDPVGTDTDNETVTLRNDGTDSVDLTGWMLRDTAGNELELSGALAANDTRTITIPGRQLPLNQSGDEVWLLDAAGQVRDYVAYTAAVVEEGTAIEF
jgi:hypothetical protein